MMILKKNKWVLGESVINFSQTIVDDTIKTNAEFHYKAGLSPKIIRTSDGNCCDWCDSVVGVYKYPDVPKDVYRRHKHCQCEVNYYPGDGKYQNAHTKKWSDLSNFFDDESVDENEGNNRLKYLSYYFARELGYNPIPADKVVKVMKEQAKVWIPALNEYEKRSITKYSFNGTDADRKKIYFKINGLFSNYYTPKDQLEIDMLLNNISNIRNGLLKNKVSNDIIVYRKDKFPTELSGMSQKFISTSILPETTLTGKANVAIIVPKGTQGAYIEPLSHSKYKNQLEFLLNMETNLIPVYDKNNLYIFRVEVEDEKK